MANHAKFRPDIEGLRALAIAPVVIFHAFPSLLPGGFVGVDVFFVISGYLIATLLKGRLEANQYSIAAFYGARIRRIFPAMFAMLALVTPIATWLLPPDGLWEFRRTLAATAVFVSNMELYGRANYFDSSTELSPLVHTWSLAVEEQFYIVFPILLAFLYRHWRMATIPVLVGLGLASLALSATWVRVDPMLAFYSAPSRTFELMIGAVLAMGIGNAGLSRSVREMAAAGGVGLIGLSCFWFDSDLPFPGIAATFPCAGAALVIWAGHGGDTIAGRLISIAPIRRLGAMSFSLYLWHWPVLVMTRHLVLGHPSGWQSGLAVLSSVLLAWASLQWIEVPVRRASHTDRRLLLAGVALIAATLAIALLLGRVERLMRPQDAATQALHAGKDDFNPRRAHCHAGAERLAAYTERCHWGHESGVARTAVWADSHGAELAVALGEHLRVKGDSIIQITASGCPPALGVNIPNRHRCADQVRTDLQGLIADGRVERVILLARYESYLGARVPDFEGGLRRSIMALTNAGKQVVLVTPLPTYHYPVPSALAALHARGQPLDGFGQTLDRYAEVQAQPLALVSRLGKLPGVVTADTARALCSTGRCAVTAFGRPAYFDDNHLSVSGARRLVESADALGPR